MTIARIQKCIAAENYDEAWEITASTEQTPEFVNELKVVAGQVRNRIIDLCHNKATEFSQEVKDKTSLLKKLNTITKQDMYGRDL